MQRNADRTRTRILAAATEEFAARGIAGARVNRIAEVAGCNKAMLYAYFGSKDGLFDAVYTAAVDAYLADVGFDTGDLPGYAGRVFDYFEDHPEHQRLNIWYRLERPEGSGLEAIVAVNKSRLGDLDQAQRSGVVPANFTPAELLALLQAIAISWSSMNPEYGARAPSKASRRAAVVDAVRRLLAS
ncbi:MULTISPECIES: TetR family transcriptional regulator [unclassified Kribbella]|uniref:TetR family transcriptional regulator n=1 Tax=unclassified Kribbella TaxID=2644121 RepID=UPI0030190F64